MLTGQHPINRAAHSMRRINFDWKPSVPPNWPDSLKQLLYGCLNFNMFDRPSAYDIINYLERGLSLK